MEMVREREGSTGSRWSHHFWKTTPCLSALETLCRRCSWRLQKLDPELWDKSQRS